MSGQQFCLRWNNHQPNFVAAFSSLLNNESLVDVTLAAEGKHIQAHRIVLSACSSYFQTLLSMNACQHPIVILKDVRYKDLKTLVEYMYYGEVNVCEDQLPAILKTAETLQIKGLTEMPEEKISLNKTITLSTETPTTSPCAIRRKRFRKCSTNSGSSSMEQIPGGSEESIERVIITSPSPSSLKAESADCPSPLHSPRELSIESETKDLSSKGSFDEDRCSLSQQQSIESNDSRKSNREESRPPSCSSQASSQGCIMLERSNLRPQVVISSPDNCVIPDCSIIPVSSTSRRKWSSNQDNVNFQEALEAVRTKKLGFCKAAKIFGVNNRSLWLEYKKRGYPTRPAPKQCKAKRNQLANEVTTTSVSSMCTTVATVSREAVTSSREPTTSEAYQPQLIPHPPHSYLSPHFDHPPAYYASSGENSTQIANMIPAHISNLYNMENYYSQQ
ncbi:unnamed protein product [Bemisia tabaci]|uniref:BTB domain-containing protein n=1 Tax=Bemisia tabaci TaxID=7038 RepID=A0A9P0A426_BEMTA|nr:unnamed protein product [Bemisia tabaci]